MIFIRRTYRLSVLIFWFLLITIAILPLQFGGLNDVKRLTYMARIWARGIVRIIKIRINVHGHVDDSNGGMIVSNHLSYLDTIVHGSMFIIRHSPKAEIRNWPFLGGFISLSRPVWVDRKSRKGAKTTSDDFIETMNHGMNIVVYPEGTSSDGKNGICPFKSAPFDAVVKGNKPVFPILTIYPDVPGRDTLCWYGDMTLVPHLWKALGAPFLDVDVYILDPIYPEGRDRKELTTYVHDVMDKEYRRICEMMSFRASEASREISTKS